MLRSVRGECPNYAPFGLEFKPPFCLKKKEKEIPKLGKSQKEAKR
jgi:hypothetical protein